MRTIRVDDHDSDHRWLWLAAGATLGLVAGVLIAEKVRGRRVGWREVARRGRTFARTALREWGPLVEAAQSIRDAWQAPVDAREQDEDREEEEIPGPAEGPGEEEFDAELEDEADEDLDELEDLEEEELDEEDLEEEELDEDAEEGLDARVLEAFLNDPLLAERDLEIEEDRAGSITLHGRVRSEKEARHAATIARGVPGVERVRERLTVRGRAR